MVRSVSGSGRVVTEERLFRSNSFLHADPFDGLISDVVVKVVIGIAKIRINRLGSFCHRRSPLTRVTPEESVEVVEAKTGWPQIKRTSLTGLPVGNIVILPEPRRAVAILLQHFSNGRCILLHHGVVSREAGRGFGDHSCMHRVMIAPGDQGCSSWTAERCGVEVVKLQAVVSQHLKGWRMAGTAKGTRRAEAHIIEQNQQNIRSSRRSLDRLRKIRL